MSRWAGVCVLAASCMRQPRFAPRDTAPTVSPAAARTALAWRCEVTGAALRVPRLDPDAITLRTHSGTATVHVEGARARAEVSWSASGLHFATPIAFTDGAGPWIAWWLAPDGAVLSAGDTVFEIDVRGGPTGVRSSQHPRPFTLAVDQADITGHAAPGDRVFADARASGTWSVADDGSALLDGRAPLAIADTACSSTAHGDVVSRAPGTLTATGAPTRTLALIVHRAIDGTALCLRGIDATVTQLGTTGTLVATPTPYGLTGTADLLEGLAPVRCHAVP